MKRKLTSLSDNPEPVNKRAHLVASLPSPVFQAIEPDEQELNNRLEDAHSFVTDSPFR